MVELHRDKFDVEFPIAPENEKVKIETPLQKIEKNLGRNRFSIDVEETTQTHFHQGPSGRGPREITLWSFAALSIDLLLSFAFTCLALMSVLLWGRYEFSDLSLFVSKNLTWFLVGVVFGVLSIYMLMLRIFLGFTIGDWACGLRLGSLQQRLSSRYSLLVLARALLNITTGAIVLPILSLLLARDIAGQITGLSLVSKR